MDALTTWLLDSDPAIRWQVLRDLRDASAEEVEAERSWVAESGWGKQLLDLQADGQWAGGACFPDGDWRRAHAEPGSQPWTATLPTLRLLRHLGVDPGAARVRAAVDGVQEHCRWEYDDLPFFGGEVEPCINGGTVAVGAYFGQDVDSVVARLLGEQLADGGWNCEAENGSTRSSFHTTICVLDGLLEYERAGGVLPVAESRTRGDEYLLTRRLYRRASTGEVADPAFLELSFPPQWHYDVLFGLDYFWTAGGTPDPRLQDAVNVLRSKRQPDGRWLLEHTHPGAVHVRLEDDGEPSRWNTLRAARVLRWYDSAAA